MIYRCGAGVEHHGKPSQVARWIRQAAITPIPEEMVKKAEAHDDYMVAMRRFNEEMAAISPKLHTVGFMAGLATARRLFDRAMLEVMRERDRL